MLLIPYFVIKKEVHVFFQRNKKIDFENIVCVVLQHPEDFFQE